MPSGISNTLRFPLCILKRIFDFAADSPSTLYALIFVCKELSSVAEALLYREIRIPKHFDTERLECLIGALSNAPRLANFVHSFTCEAVFDETVELSAKVAAVCENLEEINSLTFATDWHEYILHRPHLKSLNLNGSFSYPKPSFNLPQLLRSLSSCPNLKRFRIKENNFHHHRSSSSILITDQHHHPCPNLRTIILSYARCNASDLRFVMSLSPRVDVLELWLETQDLREEAMVIEQCLRKWSSLRELAIHPSSLARHLVQLNVPSLSDLKRLSIHESLIGVRQLRIFTQLIELDYVTTLNEDASLANNLLDPSFLPSLRKVRIFTQNIDRLNLILKEVRQARGIECTAKRVLTSSGYPGEREQWTYEIFAQ